MATRLWQPRLWGPKKWRAMPWRDHSSLLWFARQPGVRFCGASIDSPNNWAALAVDLSPYGEDLTPLPGSGSGSGNASEANHAATNGLVGDKCAEFLCAMRETSNSANLINLRDPAQASFNPSVVWGIAKSQSTDEVICRNGSGSSPFNAVTLVPPSISSVAQRYYLAWSDAANPNTTGPSDARLSTLHIWNLETGEYASATSSHAAPGHNPSPSSMCLGSLQVNGGSNNWAFDGQSIEMVRISDRPRSRQEIEAAIPYLLGV